MPTTSDTIRVLFLEDSPFDLELEFAKLNSYGFDVKYTAVETKKDFLAALKNKDIDVILADNDLPTFDGRTALRLFVKQGLDIPFIFVSGTMGEERAIECLKAGATDYVLKTNLSRLGPVVERALKEAKETRQRKQAEAALRENQHQMELLINNTIDVIWQMDAKLNFTYASPSIYNLTGFTVEEWVGTNLSKHATPKEFLKMSREALGAIKNYRTFNHVIFEAVMLRKDGSSVPVEINGRLLLNEKGFPYGLQGSTRDISQRIKNQQQLKESEERFRVLYNESPDLYVTVDAKTGNILMCNETILEETGFQKDQIVGQKIESLYDEDYREIAIQGFKNFRQTGQIRDEECFLRCADGSRIPTSLNADGVYDEDHKLLYGVYAWRDISERQELQKKAKHYLNQQVAANQLALSLGETNDLDKIYEIIFSHIKKLMDVDNFGVSFFDEEKKQIRARYIIADGTVVDAEALPAHPLKPEGKGIQSQVIHTGEYLYIDDYQEALRKADIEYILEKDGRVKLSTNYSEPVVQSCLLAPMKRRGKPVGIMQAQSYQLDAYSQDDINLFCSLANVASISIQNAELLDTLETAHAEVAAAYDSTLEGWAQALELRDMETEGHSRRVVDLTVQLATHMGLAGEALVNIQRGALLHDIGKMSVPDIILQKPGKLTKEEWAVMRLHPVYAYQWLCPFEYLRPSLDIPHYHHEKWDGTGYPAGLKGEEIPLSARIFAIIDVWDALLSDRPYRNAWSRDRALEYIKFHAGDHFDPAVAKAFIEMIQRSEENDKQKAVSNLLKREK